jgi:hypothetical protein
LKISTIQQILLTQSPRTHLFSRLDLLNATRPDFKEGMAGNVFGHRHEARISKTSSDQPPSFFFTFPFIIILFPSLVFLIPQFAVHNLPCIVIYFDAFLQVQLIQRY